MLMWLEQACKHPITLCRTLPSGLDACQLVPWAAGVCKQDTVSTDLWLRPMLMTAYLACRNMRWASPLRLTSLRTKPLARNALHTGVDSAHSQIFQYVDCNIISHVWDGSLNHCSQHG